MHTICITFTSSGNMPSKARDMTAPKGKGKSRKIHQAGQRLVRVTISLDPEDYAAFERLGEHARLSRSWLIRKAMREYLDRNRDSDYVGKLSSDRS